MSACRQKRHHGRTNQTRRAGHQNVHHSDSLCLSSLCFSVSSQVSKPVSKWTTECSVGVECTFEGGIVSFDPAELACESRLFSKASACWCRFLAVASAHLDAFRSLRCCVF